MAITASALLATAVFGTSCPNVALLLASPVVLRLLSRAIGRQPVITVGCRIPSGRQRLGPAPLLVMRPLVAFGPTEASVVDNERAQTLTVDIPTAIRLHKTQGDLRPATRLPMARHTRAPPPSAALTRLLALAVRKTELIILGICAVVSPQVSIAEVSYAIDLIRRNAVPRRFRRVASAITGTRVAPPNSLITKDRPGDIVTLSQEKALIATARPTLMVGKSANTYSFLTTVVGLDPARRRDLMATVVFIDTGARIMAGPDPNIVISLFI